jgi:hypothetical protein
LILARSCEEEDEQRHLAAVLIQRVARAIRVMPFKFARHTRGYTRGNGESRLTEVDEMERFESRGRIVLSAAILLLPTLLVTPGALAAQIFCQSNVVNCDGTDSSDVIIDNAEGHGAHVFAHANADATEMDNVQAKTGPDNIEGQNDTDTLRGNDGHDTINAGENIHQEWMIGDDGNDNMYDKYPGPGSQTCQSCEKDNVCGDTGMDTLDVLDETGGDMFYGGGGDDVFRYDAGDSGAGTHANCVSGAAPPPS